MATPLNYKSAVALKLTTLKLYPIFTSFSCSPAHATNSAFSGTSQSSRASSSPDGSTSHRWFHFFQSPQTHFQQIVPLFAFLRLTGAEAQSETPTALSFAGQTSAHGMPSVMQFLKFLKFLKLHTSRFMERCSFSLIAHMGHFHLALQAISTTSSGRS